MARLPPPPAIAQSPLLEALADHSTPPWPRGSLPAGTASTALLPQGRRPVPAGPPPSSGRASSQEKLLPAGGELAGASWPPKQGALQIGGPGRAGRGRAWATGHPKPAIVVSASLEEARGTALRGDGLSGCTTVRLKNVEPSLVPDTAIAALDANGFEGMFDFVHVPMDMAKRKNRGIIFINFVEPTAAEAMYQSFHLQTMPGVSLSRKPLEITPAYVQGFQDNFLRAYVETAEEKFV